MEAAEFITITIFSIGLLICAYFVSKLMYDVLFQIFVEDKKAAQERKEELKELKKLTEKNENEYFKFSSSNSFTLIDDELYCIRPEDLPSLSSASLFILVDATILERDEIEIVLNRKSIELLRIRGDWTD